MAAVEVMTGNQAVAHGVRLARAQVVATYPITPQTTIVEEIAKFVANGQLDAKFVNVESEHTACCVVTGAELAGARSFTATASQGLGYMLEPLTFLHAFRLPIVIAVASRTLGAPYGSGGVDYSDIMTVRDFGFIQFFVESNQEALDTVIQSYRIAEDKRVLMPAMVDLDGFYLSFSSELVAIPDQGQVDTFLPPYRPEHVILDPERPMSVADWQLRAPYVEWTNEEAMRRARSVIREVDAAFGQVFGRSYGGLVETYRCEDARVVLVTIGSVTGTAREAVDQLRSEGYAVGLLKIRVFRPFPVEEITALARQVSALAVIDRNVSHAGASTGILAGEIRNCLFDLKGEAPEVISFIAGINGADISVASLKEMALTAWRVVEGQGGETEQWIFPPTPEVPRLVPDAAAELPLLPGLNSCAGCLSLLALRHTVDVVGKDVVLIMPPGCMSVVGGIGWPGFTPIQIPSYLAVFPGTASTAAGVRAGLDALGKTDTVVLAFAGDGGTADIGLQCLSAAANRGDPLLYICYDNEAYMNTGIQKSGTTPFAADTSTTPVGSRMQGNPLRAAKDMAAIMAAHGVPYIATASVGYLSDYRKKLQKAMDVVRNRRGLAYLHVHCPCAPGWRFPERIGIEVAQKAVQCRLWNLYEIEDGQTSLTRKVPTPLPVAEYASLQGRFAHVTPEQLQTLAEQAEAEYAMVAGGGRK